MNDVVVTRTPDGQIACVTLQDDEGRILKVIADAPERQPVQPLAWSAAPNTITFAGCEMVIAEVAIDRNNTLTMYCDADQAHKVPDVLAAFAVARQPVPPLGDEQIAEVVSSFDGIEDWNLHDFARAVERLVIERMGK